VQGDVSAAAAEVSPEQAVENGIQAVLQTAVYFRRNVVQGVMTEDRNFGALASRSVCRN
jgi:hypothetical protein